MHTLTAPAPSSLPTSSISATRRSNSPTLPLSSHPAKHRSLPTSSVHSFPKVFSGLGGNTSDVGWWKATPTSKQPPLLGRCERLRMPAQRKISDSGSQLLRHTRGPSSTCAASSTPPDGPASTASTSAAARPRALPKRPFLSPKLSAPRLEYFQIGNEADGFASRFRLKETWNVEAYLDALAHCRQSCARFRRPARPFRHGHAGRRQQELHGSPPSPPSSAPTFPTAPDIAALTHHYYFYRPAIEPQSVNLTDLLKSDPHVEKDAALTVRDAAIKLHTPYSA